MLYFETSYHVHFLAGKGPRGRADPAQSPPQKGKKTGGATDDARRDARAEAQMLAENEENSKTPPPASPPPVPNKADRAVTVELNKEKAERARLQAETERLRKQLDDYTVRESKRKQSEAAEKAPPAKRAAGSGRRSASAPQSAAVSRRRLSVCTSISVIDFLLHNHDSIIMTLLF
jgi:hypothetical protein